MEGVYRIHHWDPLKNRQRCQGDDMYRPCEAATLCGAISQGEG